MPMLLHCADLHAPTLEPHINRRIAEELGREQAAQAELERVAGQPVTVMLAQSVPSRAALEISFIRFIVRPCWETLVRAAPDLGEFVHRIDRNVQMWEGLQSTVSGPVAASGSGAGSVAGAAQSPRSSAARPGFGATAVKVVT